MCRGMYRSSRNKWFHPDDVTPNNSEIDKDSGGMRTPMLFNNDIKAYQIELYIPKKYVPLTFGFSIYNKGTF